MNEKILDNFDHENISKYELNHTFVSTYHIELSMEKSRDGNGSLKVIYDYSGWTSGNGAMYIKFKSLASTKRMPVKVGVWVYSEGEVPWLRVIVVDGNGERKTLNLTDHTMTWIGWKYVDAEIDSSWSLPLRVDEIYAVEVDKSKQGSNKYKGEFYIDQLRFVYGDHEDLQGPYFINTYPDENIIYRDAFVFQTKVVDAKTGVDPQSIIVKVNNQVVKHDYSLKTGLISHSLVDLQEGDYEITVSAKDNAGNISVPSLKKSYKIDLSPDLDAPVISNLTPSETAIVYTYRPRISFHIVDEKSGIDVKDITVHMNSKKQSVYYDEKTGWAYALSTEKLRPGNHQFNIKATDRAGNQLGPITNNFTIGEMKKRSEKGNIKVAVIPDTHSDRYGKLAFKETAKDDVDFIIQMGDLVDQATSEEFSAVERNISILANRPLLTVPGNHESFHDNLNSYMNLFGSPTYHLEYGNALFIFLNTAYNQSISESDSTQFHFLENIIRESEKNNIVFITHVPTKDHFGTAHEMNKQDADKLEGILRLYKKNHSEKNITVLFGHLHVLHKWEKDDIEYIITGNSAQKGYVSHDKGNILGYGLLEITKSGILYHYKPYVHEVHIFSNHTEIEQLTIQKGNSSKLELHITVNKLASKYTVNITPHTLIRRNWSSSNEEIVHVTDEGLVQALRVGEAFILVKVLDEFKEIKVRIE